MTFMRCFFMLHEHGQDVFAWLHFQDIHSGHSIYHLFCLLTASDVVMSVLRIAQTSCFSGFYDINAIQIRSKKNIKYFICQSCQFFQTCQPYTIDCFHVRYVNEIKSFKVSIAHCKWTRKQIPNQESSFNLPLIKRRLFSH